MITQREAIDNTLERLNYKIDRYNQTIETGVLKWDKMEV
ncbi:hypothetical protein J2Z34_000750 [Youngiibacter multivorans]|uniref:Uncharacterized protein n=1 Tax=Youngiibacter multivorans TaxID=937251 RepID=A0ABS4G160_9CLOT|nr:hypothetical protein [Youngiibacter multivorans]